MCWSSFFLVGNPFKHISATLEKKMVGFVSDRALAVIGKSNVVAAKLRKSN
jgi:hypothetical protein